MTSTIAYSITANENNDISMIVSIDNEVHTFGNTHVNFDTIREYFAQTLPTEWDAEHLRGLITPVLEAGNRLTRLSERVSIMGNTLRFDGDLLDSAITNHIIRLFQQNDTQGWEPLVQFLEKISQNPSESSRTELYEWLRERNLTILPDGNFIAYKGVVPDAEDANTLVSVHSGEAIVNDEYVVGQIPNRPGSTISMERSKVDPDQFVGCSTGLHAGTWEYASRFVSFTRGSQVLTVSINPRDVVSVPRDCDSQKLRVSRYVVINSIENPLNATTTAYNFPEENEQEEKDEENLKCKHCGGGSDECENYDVESACEGFDEDGYDVNGYDEDGFDEDGFDRYGYNCEGFDEDGYDSDGYDRYGFNQDGYDEDGYGIDGFDRYGFDYEGYDENGFDREGYDQEGYSAEGFNRSGFDNEGYDEYGYDEYGYNRDGYNRRGFDRDGYHQDGYDLSGFDRRGNR